MIHKGLINRSIPQIVVPERTPTSPIQDVKLSDQLSNTSQYLGFNTSLLQKFKLQFNRLVVPDDYLSETEVGVLKEVVNKLEKLSLDIKVAMEDFKGVDAATTGKQGNQKLEGVKVAGRELVEEIYKEIYLYKEFIKGGENLTLESIMNEEESSETSSVNYFSTLSPSLTALSPLSPLSQLEDGTELNFEMQMNNILKTSRDTNVDSMLSWVQLLPITQQLFSEKLKEIAGFPTCITVSKYIIFGTSRGIIVIFDFKQQLKWVLGNGAIALEHGSVSALSISSDGSWVAVGYSKGMLLVYRIDTGYLVATILPAQTRTKRYLSGSRSAHLKNSRITAISFVGSGKRFVSGDGFGVVCLHSVANQFTKVSGRCRKILDVSDAELADGEPTNPIVALQALSFGNTDHLADKVGLVAAMTLHQLTILRIRPKPEVLLTLRRDHIQSGVRAQLGPSDGHFFQHGATAICQWFPCYKDGFHQTQDPQLAVAWGNYLTVLRIGVAEIETSSTLNLKTKQPQLELFKVDHYSQSSAVVSINWINERNLLVVDKSERIWVYDVHYFNRASAVSSLSDCKPYQFSLQRKANEFYYQLGDELLPIYNNGIHVYKGKLFVLGQHEVFIGMPLTWSDHLKLCVSQGDAYHAIGLAIEYLREGPKYHFSHLPLDLEERKQVVGPQLRDLVVASCRHIVASDLSDINNDSEVKAVVRKCVEASLELSTLELLFEDVLPSLLSKFPSPCYQVLLDYVVNPTPSSIDLIKHLPPSLLTSTFQFFAHESLEGRRYIEPLLYNLDVASLDLNFLVDLLNRLNLIDGVMYLWSNAFLDFLTPVSALLQKTSLDPTVTTSKLFNYLTSSLEGRSYPDRKPINRFSYDQAVRQLFDLLTARHLVHLTDGSTLNLPEVWEDLPYPYLQFLLSTNPNRTGTVLEKLKVAVDATNSSADLSYEKVLRILLELIQINTDLDGFSNVYVYHLLVSQPSAFVQSLNAELCELMFETFLVDVPEKVDIQLAQVKQASLHSLVKFYKPQDLYQQLESHQQYTLLLQLYQHEDDTYNSLRCYFLGSTDQTNVFDLISGSYPNLSDEEKPKTSELVWDYIDKLVALNAEATFNLVANQFANDHLKVISKLSEQPELKFNYLKACLSDLKTVAATQLPLLDTYIELLCQYDPTAVLPLLAQMDKLQLSYDAESTLQNTRKFTVIEATIYLLEVDSPLVAIDELLALLLKRLEPTHQIFRKLDASTNITNELVDKVHSGLIRIQATVDLAIKLGDRVHLRFRQLKGSASNVEIPSEETYLAYSLTSLEPLSNDCETLYFRLLDTIVNQLKLLLAEIHRVKTQSSQPEAKSSRLDLIHQSVTDTFRTLIQNLFNSILHPAPQLNPKHLPPGSNQLMEVRVVSIPKLLVRVLSRNNPPNPTASSNPTNSQPQPNQSDPILGEFRDLLVGVLATCHAESHWLLLAAKLTTQDKFELVDELNRWNKKGRRGFAPRCITCRKRLMGTKGTVTVFMCGHVGHTSCIQELNGEGGNRFACTKCTS